MNSDIKVSVIVPVYNVEPYLKKCLNSLVNQTISRDMEIVCINDASPDGCLNILKQYQEKYGNRLIKIIDHKENMGVAISRNDGLAAAKGEYLGFVDPDDWVDLNFFEVLYNRGVETGADIVKGNFKKFKNNLYSLSDQNKKIKNNPINFVDAGWCSAIYKKDIVETNNIVFPNIQNCEDNVFLTKCKFYANKIEVLDNIFYYYFCRKNSLTKDSSKRRIYSIIEYSKIIVDFINSINISKDYYVFYINHIINELIAIFAITEYNVDKTTENNIINAIFDVYSLCKYKEEYCDKYSSEYTDYLTNKDSVGLKEYFLNGYCLKKSFRIFKYIVILKIKYKEHKKCFYFLNCIPILEIYKETNYITHYKLFNFIPLLTIRKN